MTAGSATLASNTAGLFAQIAPNWKNQIGLELFTVPRLLSSALYCAGDYKAIFANAGAAGLSEHEDKTGPPA